VIEWVARSKKRGRVNSASLLTGLEGSIQFSLRANAGAPSRAGRQKEAPTQQLTDPLDAEAGFCCFSFR